MLTINAIKKVNINGATANLENIFADMQADAKKRLSSVNLTLCANNNFSRIAEADLPSVEQYADSLGMKLVYFAKSPYNVSDIEEAKRTRCETLAQAIEVFHNYYGTEKEGKPLIPCISIVMNRK